MSGVEKQGRNSRQPRHLHLFPVSHLVSSFLISCPPPPPGIRYLHLFSFPILVLGLVHLFLPLPAFSARDESRNRVSPQHCSSRLSQCTRSCVSHHRVDEDEIYWGSQKHDGDSGRSDNSAHVISQLAQCFTNAMVGPRTWIGGILSRSSNKRYGSDKLIDYTLTPEQEERLHKLQERLGVPFDEFRPDHREALLSLWNLSFPDVKLKGLISEQWKDMGWQGSNPSTDFRGCGFLSLENLLYFARNYAACFHRLLLKQVGDRATWEYPFAVAGINVSFMLIQMLDLCSAKPRCLPGINFVKLLAEDEDAFDVLYCIAFAMMDAQWLAMHASYMDFNFDPSGHLSGENPLEVCRVKCSEGPEDWHSNRSHAPKDVLQVTRLQLERELSLEDINRMTDLPAYNLV